MVTSKIGLMRLGYGMVASGGLHSEVFLHLGFLYVDIIYLVVRII